MTVPFHQPEQPHQHKLQLSLIMWHGCKEFLTVTSKYAAFPSMKSGWNMSPGRWLDWPLHLCSFLTPLLSVRKACHRISLRLSWRLMRRELLPQDNPWSPNWSKMCPQIQRAAFGCCWKMGVQEIKSCFEKLRPNFSLGIALRQAPAWVDEIVFRRARSLRLYNCSSVKSISIWVWSIFWVDSRVIGSEPTLQEILLVT